MPNVKPAAQNPIQLSIFEVLYTGTLMCVSVTSLQVIVDASVFAVVPDWEENELVMPIIG